MKSPRRALRWFLAVPFFAALIGFGLWHGALVKAEQQGSLFEGLRTTAAIIFGVMGAWIAIVYPESLKRILDPRTDDEAKHAVLVRQLLTPILFSTAILAVVLVGAPIASVVQKFNFYQQHEDLFLRLSFATLLLLTALEFWAVLLSLVPIGVAEATTSGGAQRKAGRRSVLSQTSVAEQRSKEEKPDDGV